MRLFRKYCERGAFAVALCSVIPTAVAVELVTRAEVEESRRGLFAVPPIAARALEGVGGPRIDLISPDTTRSVKSPVEIAVRFTAVAPAKIEPESLRIFYGAFRLNITDRIRKVAAIREDGITVDGAELPAGNHRLVLVISDSAGRVIEKDIRFNVE